MMNGPTNQPRPSREDLEKMINQTPNIGGDIKIDPPVNPGGNQAAIDQANAAMAQANNQANQSNSTNDQASAQLAEAMKQMEEARKQAELAKQKADEDIKNNTTSP
ncbi:hypothetical protein PPL_10576 [Heterostelium album PN500]|uniref:Uncharacterized protein n=1 Tax=Heterostelium pallidum (strain ATCC 26659 / Pp 5 / PN500) TaxID=670386 RepID=D3BRG5_HETP5|nr:hypothetical protein PPL_10576 [Heterostelium album PN500]EFA75997.1 hypothetical protein PPL_10576 [Heterostelium album PN500]|eukprot:XP_020428131.1 hypothetical protein PPL_10576 [Heterostelium album PN500]